MKDNKLLILIIFILVFVIAVNYFTKPVENVDSRPDDSEELKNLKREFDQLSIDYLNLEGENKNLEHEIEILNGSIFELTKSILQSDIANDFFTESTEIIHREFEDDRIIVLYKNDTGNRLILLSKKSNYVENLELHTLYPEEGFSWEGGMGPDFYFFGGVITDNQIKQVRVLQNDIIHEANIITVNDHLNIWYSIFDYEKKSITDKPEMLKIETLDNDGVILWEEAFAGPLGG